MTDNIIIDSDGIEQQPLQDFTEKAYLDYSMYVILDRALPHIGDGLKPVQRRIIYAMSELGLSSTAKYKKAARTVGDVLGKFHPHGDSACYEAMVHMAQPFTYRYPLVDGQGNWGAPDDPKSFAAMRYTEAKLTKFAEVLLAELGQGTVDWKPNFDGTMDEPCQLPSRLPHVLLNGITGIAVGMSTDIPPHNVREMVSACIRLLEAPKSTVAELCEHVRGPDYPTDAEIITPADELLKMYETGSGSIRMRAIYEIENGDIIVTSLPHQVSGAKILEQIAAQMMAKKLPMVEDLRDESDHENPTRLVIVPRSNRIDTTSLMLHLFASTDLERTYRVNMNVIALNGKPQRLNLRDMLKEWLIFRTQTVTRRLQYRLDKVDQRMHILAGLLVAYLNLDEVIDLIRTAEEPKQALMQRFDLSEIQANAILDIRLRQLAKLEEVKIRAEQAELAVEKTYLESILGSNARLKTLIRNELIVDAEMYGDDRRSPLAAREPAQAMSETDLVSAEPVTIVLSEKGWVRAAKGHEVDGASLTYKSGDTFLSSAPGRSNQPAMFIDSSGRCYALPAHTLPTARGQGEPLTGKLSPPEGAVFRGVMAGGEEAVYLLASDAGYGFVAKLGDLYSKNKKGKTALTVPKGAKVLEPTRVENIKTDQIVTISADGHLLITPLADIPQMARGKGNKIVAIPTKKFADREDFVVFMTILPKGANLVIHAGQRHVTLKAKDLAGYKGERGKRGRKLPRGLQRVDSISIELK